MRCYFRYGISHDCFINNFITSFAPTTMATSTDTRYSCKECDKPFSEMEDLLVHTMAHIDEDLHILGQEKSDQCEQCNQSFGNLKTLRIHIQSHKVDKQYICQQCHKAVSSAKALKVHTLTHKGEKLHKCQECDKAFTTAGNLKTHTQIHTRGKPFRTHTGEKPFMCQHCDYSFIQASDLQVHMRIHTGEKPHRQSGNTQLSGSPGAFQEFQNLKLGDPWSFPGMAFFSPYFSKFIYEPTRYNYSQTCGTAV